MVNKRTINNVPIDNATPIDKATFEESFDRLIQSIAVDSDNDNAFAIIHLLNSPPYELFEVVHFAREHMKEHNEALAAKNREESSANKAFINGDKQCANAYSDAAKSAGIYAICAYKARLAAYKISETQDRFSDAVMKSSNVLACAKIREYASKNNDAYSRYLRLRNELHVAAENYSVASKKAIDIFHKRSNIPTNDLISNEYTITIEDEDDNQNRTITIEDKS